jgi:hypothetical protein
MLKVVVFIIKNNISNNNQSVCNHAEFVGIAEVTFDASGTLSKPQKNSEFWGLSINYWILMNERL